ncbi:MAG: amidohydrolase family protein [Parvularculaceae bacterium]|nr:amidohydrolase family protein [Parvularculaceae bacterium]
MKQNSAAAAALCLLAACSAQEKEAANSAPSSAPDAERFTVIIAGAPVGALTFSPDTDGAAIEYAYSNNGRGPSIKETIAFGDDGLPADWTISGRTVFGNEVEERFSIREGEAIWRDAAGEGAAQVSEPSIYVSQFASPYAVFFAARALLADDDRTMPALPAGALTLSEIETFSVNGTSGAENVTTFALKGASLDPDYFALDADNRLFAVMSPRFVAVREGFEAEEKRLRDLAAKYGADRFEAMQAQYAHRYEKPVRIRNVRIFDPAALAMTDLSSVVIVGDRIARIEAADAEGGEGEVSIDAAGGSLVPGIHDMHAHIGDDEAMLNLLAGVTSVRDMGNEIDVLEPLRAKIEAGTLAGPRISMSGFIEGESETSNATGELARSEQEAVDLVNMYADRGGYFQIKVYSSIRGEWVPAMAAAAHARGLRVAGHVPAFSTPDEMIAAGYDELTHINQVMLSWVLEPQDDTRTLKRITGMRAFAGLDLNSEKVQATVNAIVDNKIAVDPTTVIHEYALKGRNGETRAGVVDYIDNMPVSLQRDAKVALLNVADEAEDADYRASYDKIIELLTMLHDRGVFIVPGTDMGGAFELHREIELMTTFGFTPAEALRRANLDMARYLGFDDRGSIEEGKLADFFLVPGDPTKDIRAIKKIALVSRGGAFYYPSEIYPEFGITPFTAHPAVSGDQGE